jgi:hypothetical protein
MVNMDVASRHLSINLLKIKSTNKTACTIKFQALPPSFRVAFIGQPFKGVI